LFESNFVMKDCQSFWSTRIFIVLKEAEISIGENAFQSRTTCQA